MIGKGLLVKDDAADNSVGSVFEDGAIFCSSKCTPGVALAECFVVRVGPVRAEALRAEA